MMQQEPQALKTSPAPAQDEAVDASVEAHDRFLAELIHVVEAAVTAEERPGADAQAETPSVTRERPSTPAMPAPARRERARFSRD